jgi:hypothetical protein
VVFLKVSRDNPEILRKIENVIMDKDQVAGWGEGVGGEVGDLGWSQEWKEIRFYCEVNAGILKNFKTFYFRRVTLTEV